MKNNSSKFNNNNIRSQNSSFHSNGDSIIEKIQDQTNQNEVDKTFELGQEDLSHLKSDNFVDSVGIEYQNLMNEMGPNGGQRLPSAIKPSNFSDGKSNTLNNPTTIHISSNLDTLEQKIKELRQKRDSIIL